MKKLLLYIKMNILYMFRNKVRFALTILGISIGLFVYLLGNVAINAYISNMYKKAYNFAENTYLIYDRQNEIVDKIISEKENVKINQYSLLTESYLINEYNYRNTNVNNSIRMIGVSNTETDNVVPYVDDDSILVTDSNIIYGRNFLEEEINEGKNCIIIEKSAAMFIFQKENAVGEYIDYVTPYGYSRYEIIGVIEDLPITKTNNINFNRLMKSEDNGEYYNSFNGYIPNGSLSRLVGETNLEIRYIVNYNRNNEQEIQQYMNNIMLQIKTYGIDVSIVSRDTMIDDVRILENRMRDFINILIFAIIFISGFMIMIIYIFSVKERMYEIGVRRAVGASGFDIVMQFVIEGVATALIAGIVTVFSSIIICNIVTSYLVSCLYIDISLIVTNGIIVATIGISLLQGIIFCFIPALIASKIQPTEVIRWD